MRWWTGPRRQIQTVYAQMTPIMQAHRIAVRENGLPWEIVHMLRPADGSSPTRIEIDMHAEIDSRSIGRRQS